ncbi:MAG: hypothetical protein J1F13_07315 [Prevotellaceae bacterium]|nr:hypothetical protein [Prevotellaceae bacterium]
MWDIIGYIAFGLFVAVFTTAVVVSCVSARAGKKAVRVKMCELIADARSKERMVKKMVCYLVNVTLCMTLLWVVNLFGVESEGFGWRLTGYAVIGVWVLAIVLLFIGQCIIGWQREEPEAYRKKREARAYKRRRFWQSIFGYGNTKQDNDDFVFGVSDGTTF